MRFFWVLLGLCFVCNSFAQDRSGIGMSWAEGSSSPDPVANLGLRLEEAYGLYGMPRSVRALRGPEAWQDDVIFSYEGFELYWYKDRVWQVATEEAFGIKSGDAQSAVLAVLGEPLNIIDGAYIYQLPGRPWPVRIRIGFDEKGLVKVIYIFRADY